MLNPISALCIVRVEVCHKMILKQYAGTARLLNRERLLLNIILALIMPKVEVCYKMILRQRAGTARLLIKDLPMLNPISALCMLKVEVCHKMILKQYAGSAGLLNRGIKKPNRFSKSSATNNWNHHDAMLSPRLLIRSQPLQPLSGLWHSRSRHAADLGPCTSLLLISPRCGRRWARPAMS